MPEADVQLRAVRQGYDKFLQDKDLAPGTRLSHLQYHRVELHARFSWSIHPGQRGVYVPWPCPDVCRSGNHRGWHPGVAC
jgi:hypothetical protein